MQRRRELDEVRPIFIVATDGYVSKQLYNGLVIFVSPSIPPMLIRLANCDDSHSNVFRGR